MIKTGLKKNVFGPITEDLINLDKDNVDIYEVTFTPEYFRDEGDGYIYLEDEFFCLHLRDIDVVLNINIEINYEYVYEHHNGDYYTPPSCELVYEALDVYVEKVWVEANTDDMEVIPTNFDNTILFPKLVDFIEDYITLRI